MKYCILKVEVSPKPLVFANLKNNKKSLFSVQPGQKQGFRLLLVIE